MSKIYECKICNFQSDRLSNYNAHCETDKHKRLECIYDQQTTMLENFNVSKYVCKCGKIYTSRYGLYYHEKRCDMSEKYDKIKLITKEISKAKQLVETHDLEKKDVLNLLDKLEHRVTNKEKKPKKVTKHKQVNALINAPINNITNAPKIDNSVNKNNGTIDNSVKMATINVRNYVTTNNYAPEPLMILTEKEVLKLLELNPEKSGDHCLGELILFYYGKQLFSQFIGEFIVKAYKYEDPQYQKFWASDIDRLTFLIRKTLQDKGEWVPDKGGICITKFVITPVIETVNNKVNKYVDMCKELLETTTDYDLREKYGNYLCDAKKLFLDIELKKAHSKVLRYIAPYFQLEL